MERLNYFNPYDSKSSTHEDQLSRAYLVLLKHSFHAFTMFFNYCKKQQGVLNDSEADFYLHELLDDGWQLETQKCNPPINTDWLLSVLISNDAISSEGISIVASEREARYDGVISFGEKLTMVIENKPRLENVWNDQLNPSKTNLFEKTRIYRKPACLSWREIIKQLNNLLNLPTLAGSEKIIIEDFLSFIDDQFSYLNPFDKFHLCKNNPELLQRRIQNVLRLIVKDQEAIKYHNGWGFNISTPYNPLTKIGLILEFEADSKWHLDLSFNFAETQNQAWQFYNSNPNINGLPDNGKWHCRSNFHLAFMSTNLIWMVDNKLGNEGYINYWKENKGQIHQHGVEQIPAFLRTLDEAGVLEITTEIEQRMDLLFYATERKKINVCPGFVATYSISSDEAIELDRKGEFGNQIKIAIQQGLSIIHKDGSEFLKL